MVCVAIPAARDALDAPEATARPTPRSLARWHRARTWSGTLERMRLLSLVRFNALAGYARHPMTAISEEMTWFEHSSERVLGIVVRDLTDNDFAGLALARARRGSQPRVKYPSPAARGETPCALGNGRRAGGPGNPSDVLSTFWTSSEGHQSGSIVSLTVKRQGGR